MFCFLLFLFIGYGNLSAEVYIEDLDISSIDKEIGIIHKQISKFKAMVFLKTKNSIVQEIDGFYVSDFKLGIRQKGAKNILLDLILDKAVKMGRALTFADSSIVLLFYTQAELKMFNSFLYKLTSLSKRKRDILRYTSLQESSLYRELFASFPYYDYLKKLGVREVDYGFSEGFFRVKSPVSIQKYLSIPENNLLYQSLTNELQDKMVELGVRLFVKKGNKNFISQEKEPQVIVLIRMLLDGLATGGALDRLGLSTLKKFYWLSSHFLSDVEDSLTKLTLSEKFSDYLKFATHVQSVSLIALLRGNLGASGMRYIKFLKREDYLLYLIKTRETFTVQAEPIPTYYAYLRAVLVIETMLALGVKVKVADGYQIFTLDFLHKITQEKNKEVGLDFFPQYGVYGQVGFAMKRYWQWRGKCGSERVMDWYSKEKSNSATGELKKIKLLISEEIFNRKK